ncbi:MAG TPA: hypothetical protein VGC64_10710 [Pyrinomonadaceae bacterium]|jgi:hypothetical protein
MGCNLSRGAAVFSGSQRMRSRTTDSLHNMKQLKWHQWLVLVLFLLALALTGLFGVRAVRRAIYWRNHRDEPIRAWMSVGYVAHSYHVPPHVLYQAIKVEPVPHDRRPLRELAHEQNRSVETLIAELQEAIIHARPPYPPPQRPEGGAAP